MKIGIAVPTPDQLDPEFSLISLPQLIGYTKKMVPDIELVLTPKSGVMTSSNRNFIVDNFLKRGDIDYILHLDADMVYPKDMIVKYLEQQVDVVGCVYFRRDPPHDPVVYMDNDKDNKDVYPFTSIDPRSLPHNQLVPVGGLGFGGLMVKTSVYHELGADKWHRYGPNFGIPGEISGKLSHDLVFCQTLKKHGFVIHVHTGVVAGHITKKIVFGPEDRGLVDISAVKLEKSPKIAVIMPSLDKKLADRAVNQLLSRAGIVADYFPIIDYDLKGFVKVVNDFVNDNRDYDYYVYVAQDAYAGKDWLKIATLSMEKTKAWVFAFNDGKWHGSLASFGMVSRDFTNHYDKNKPSIFWHEYKSHYADTEITLIAQQHSRMAYSPEAVLVEIDYNKHGVNEDDRRIFNARKAMFPTELQERFS